MSLNPIIYISKQAATKVQQNNYNNLSLSSSDRGRTWKLITSDEMKTQKNNNQLLATNEEVKSLLEMVANNHRLPADFACLKKCRKFNDLAKKHAETEEHKALREKLDPKIKRAKEAFAVIVEGVKSLHEKNLPYRVVGHDYLLREVVAKDLPLAVPLALKLEDLWRKADTSLNFNEWILSLKDDPEEKGTSNALSTDFLTSLTVKEWEKLEKKAFVEQLQDGKEFNEEEFISWNKTQYDENALLAEPKWLLEKIWSERNDDNKAKGEKEVSYDDFVKKMISDRKGYWEEECKSEKGLYPFDSIDDATFKRLEKYAFQYAEKTASPLIFDVYVAKEIWKETALDSSDKAFLDYVNHNRYEFEKKKTKNEISFEKWLEKDLETLKSRWEASRVSLPFDVWKRQQVLDPLTPTPFVSLNAEERKAYLTNCKSGTLERTLNGETKPFATTNESTAHSGKGWVIFVIGPNDDLYAGSHLHGVFHHSSFLGNRAVRAAGEIKTDDNGKITHISGKSGHYRPGQAENVALLKWFASNGVDLKTVEFTCFLPKESEPINAAEYLADPNKAVPKKEK